MICQEIVLYLTRKERNQEIIYAWQRSYAFIATDWLILMTPGKEAKPEQRKNTEFTLGYRWSFGFRNVC